MPSKKYNLNNTNLSLLSWASIIIFLIIYLVFDDLGLIKLFELKSKKIALQEEIKKIKSNIEENIYIENMLINDFEYIEKIAREQFRMVRPGEKVFRVRDERTIK